MWLFEYMEYICPLLCFVFCVVHSIISCLIARSQGKKIDRLCNKCGQPVIGGETHTCDPELLSLLQSQRLLLDRFIEENEENVDT